MLGLHVYLFLVETKPAPKCYQHLGPSYEKVNMKIYTINGVCGSGKTQAMIKYVTKHYAADSKFIIAQPTIRLCQETAVFFSQCGIEAQLITSDDQVGSTQAAYKRAISQAIKDKTGCVIITTHRTFLNADTKPHQRKRFNVFFDEVPQVDSTTYLNLKHSHKSFLADNFEVTSCDENELMAIYIKVGSFSTIDGYRIAGTQRKDLLYTDPALIQFMESMLDRNRVNYLNKAKWMLRDSQEHQLIMHSILQPTAFGGWNSCRIMGANIEDSMMYQIWPHYDVTFAQDLNKEFQLTTSHDDLKNRKIGIHYFCGRPWSKHTRDAGGLVALNALNKAVNDLFGQQPSLVVANNDIESFDLLNSTRISNICHGINEHRDKHNIMFISALNDVPAHYGFLSRWQGIDATALKKAKGMETMYQAIMRTSLRDKTSTAEVKIVVPDIDAANFLADMLPNATVHAMDEICHEWGKPQVTRGRPRKEQTVSNTERSTKHRAAKAARKKAHDDLLRKITTLHPDGASIPVTCQDSIYEAKHNLTNAMVASWDDIRDLIQTASELRYSDKADNSLINFVRFKVNSATKGKDDIEYVHGIQLDFDGGALPWIDASQLFNDFKHLTYNSFNNGKNGDAKYRIMIPFDTPVTGVQAEQLWDTFKARIESAGYYVGRDAGKSKLPNSGLDMSKRPANSFYYAPSKAGVRAKHWSFFDTSCWDRPLFNAAIALENWVPKQPVEYYEIAPVSNAGPALQGMLTALSKRCDYDGEAEAQKRRAIKIEKAEQEWRLSQQQAGHGHSGLFTFAWKLLKAGLDKYETKQIMYQNMIYARSPAERMRELDTQIASAMKWY